MCRRVLVKRKVHIELLVFIPHAYPYEIEAFLKARPREDMVCRTVKPTVDARLVLFAPSHGRSDDCLTCAAFFQSMPLYVHRAPPTRSVGIVS